LRAPLVVELLDELAGVEVRTPVALVVDALAVEHLRPALAVEFRHAEGQQVGHDAGHHFRDRRAARDLDHRLAQHLVDRTAWVGFGLAACTQPQEAQEPQAMTWAAWSAIRFSFSR